MKRFLYIALLLVLWRRTAGAKVRYRSDIWATWTAVQIYTPDRTTCGMMPTGLSCTYTLPSVVGAGHALSFQFVTQDDADTAPQQVLVTLYACVTGPCTSSNNLETWVINPTPASGPGCRNWNSGQNAGSVDCAVVYSSVGGWTNLTFTRTNPNGLMQTFGGDVIELSTDAGAFYLAYANSAIAAPSLSMTMTSFSLPVSGSSTMLQAIVSDPSSVTNCANLFVSAHYGYCENLNTSTTTTPVWTLTNTYSATGNVLVWGEGTPPPGSSVSGFRLKGVIVN